MMRGTLQSVLIAICLSTLFACGMGISDPSSGDSVGSIGGTISVKDMTETDKRLSGQWMAEMLNKAGDRILLTITPETGRQIGLTGIKPSGETVGITSGQYKVQDNKITFTLIGTTSYSTNFTIGNNTLTLGTDVYDRVTGSMDGPQFGGQIQIAHSLTNEVVKAKAVDISSAVTGEILVKYKNGGLGKITVQPDPSDVQALSVQAKDPTLSALGLNVLAGREAMIKKASETIQQLNRQSNVEWAGHNRLLRTQSLDPDFKDQWNLDLLDMTDTWSGFVKSAKKVVVAVVDTGYDGGHPDLTGRVEKYGYDFVSMSVPGTPDLSLDGDGPDSDFTDPGWPGSIHHGTHLMGIIAANSDNNIGIAGIGTPNVSVLVLRAMGNGGNGTLFDVAQAIRYAAKLPNIADCDFVPSSFQGQTTYTVDQARCFDKKTANKDTERDNRPMANVINLSLGAEMTVDEAKPLTDAIDEATKKGVLVVASAGNEHSGSSTFYPAAHPYVLSVGAISSNLSFASSYSNYGIHQVVAPGGSGSDGILSTFDGNYSRLVGTSQSAAHVSAIAAMIMAENANLRPADVVKILEDSAIDLGDRGKDRTYGYGLINPCNALMRARGESPTPASSFHLTTKALDFGPVGATSTVIGNGCGLIGDVTATAKTSDGGDWLTATVVQADTYARIDISVNRGKMKDGNYAGTVTVEDQLISVKMRVSPMSPNGDDLDSLLSQIDKFLNDPAPAYQNNVDVGTMIVLLIDAKTGASKYYLKTNMTANYNFLFGGLAPGNYYLFAGLDENSDNKICVPGESEACSAYPARDNPEVIQITGTTRKNDLVWNY